MKSVHPINKQKNTNRHGKLLYTGMLKIDNIINEKTGHSPYAIRENTNSLLRRVVLQDTKFYEVAGEKYSVYTKT